MTYTAEKPPLPEPLESVRGRVPGWGVDLDPADRPSYPRERLDPGATGAHWHLPEQQPELWPRERSIEHARLTPVFGTACPPKGLSGIVRKLAYRRYSEARAAHWLLLLGADRIDAVESHLRSLASVRPDNPLTQTGIRAEFSHHGWRSRVSRGRTDLKHQVLDPVVVVGPWLGAAWLARAGLRRIRR